MRRVVTGGWKVAVSFGILAYLLTNMSAEAAQVCAQPKQWGCLVAGFLLCGSAITLTLVRWGMLVRALGVTLPTTQALRIGYVAYLCNFVAPLGIAGGDGVKIAMLAWRHPDGLGKAAASVLVDRFIGLYTLFVLASAAIVLSGFPPTQSVVLGSLSQMTLGLTATGTIVILGLLALRVPATPLVRVVSRIPLLGKPLGQLLESILRYRRRPSVLAAAATMSISVHLLFATGVYFIAWGLPGPTHSYAHHLVILPLSAVAGILPLPLGPFEWSLETLYCALPLADGSSVAAGRGLLIALGYRLATLSTAGVGAAISLIAIRPEGRTRPGERASIHSLTVQQYGSAAVNARTAAATAR